MDISEQGRLEVPDLSLKPVSHLNWVSKKRLAESTYRIIATSQIVQNKNLPKPRETSCI